MEVFFFSLIPYAYVMKGWRKIALQTDFPPENCHKKGKFCLPENCTPRKIAPQKIAPRKIALLGKFPPAWTYLLLSIWTLNLNVKKL